MHSNVKINSSHSKENKWKCNSAWSLNWKMNNFSPFALAFQMQENVNWMHPVVENVFIINYVAFFFWASRTNEFIYLFKDGEQIFCFLFPVEENAIFFFFFNLFFDGEIFYTKSVICRMIPFQFPSIHLIWKTLTWSTWRNLSWRSRKSSQIH